MRRFKRVIDIAPLALFFVGFYVEFSNIVMGRWFWLLLAVLATVYAVYKLACLIPAGSTEASLGKQQLSCRCRARGQ